jgi:1-acyl-sn-glycerol-3-phosphate acyltransferase
MRIFGPFRFLYKLYFGLIYLLSGVVLYPYFFFALRGKNKYKRAVKVKKVWANTICFFTFMRIKVLNKELFPNKGPYVVCANHGSYLDIILMYKIIPHDFAFLGKSEVLKWPVISVFFKRGIDIPVFRGDRKKAAESLLEAHRALQSGRSIAIFPEGTIGENPPDLLRFKNGAFSMAIQNQVPIVPITFLNNYKLFSGDHTDFFGPGRPGIAKVLIHPAIIVNEKTDLVSLRNQTYQLIKQSWK